MLGIDSVAKLDCQTLVSRRAREYGLGELYLPCVRCGKSEIGGKREIHSEIDFSYNSGIDRGSQSSHMGMENKPALVLDNSCLNQHDYSNFLMGKVKDFTSLSNLKVVLGNEGFDNIELKYMGGYWIMIEFQLEETKQMFQSNVGIGSWSSQLKQALNDFIIDGRVTWVEIKGIPLKLWYENTFNRIASIWGTLLHIKDQDDECYHRKRICINTNVNSNIFESFKAIYQVVEWRRCGFQKFSASEGDNENEVVPDSMFKDELYKINGEEGYVGQSKANLKEPFNLYDLLNKKKDENNKGLAQKAKKDWVKELCLKIKVNFLSLQETKMKKIELFCIQNCWGNFAFDYAYSASVGNSVGILCVWDPITLKKLNTTVSDYCIDYLSLVMENWNGEVIIMGDFNEVHKNAERSGLVFNVQGADACNMFISNAGFEVVPLGGCLFTWCHKSATKMSKIDQFLISESLLSLCPNISAVSLDRYLSDHHPILMRESYYDYGPVPFRFFHYWFDMEDFDKLLEESWKAAPVADINAIIKMMKKLKYLIEKIHVWNKMNKEGTSNKMRKLKADLAELDVVIDKGEGDEDVVNKRTNVVRSLRELEKLQSVKVAQKAKIKWAIEGDENSKYYHGILNKKRSQLAIRGILIDGN
ncbi:RNA-directed DNA polymerase, eukaryota [Tanacetum coccineum]